ncbi:thiopeptide-type bacteriocin biosynthesis protein [Saccharothrix sp. HUAS TT1]|uniref:thiopeptide-type bacteriocin biosynthesis protein n=1 Tax=unclassified Saccharothrix TaxID=2593673 RepID=UPI00345B7467
MSPGYLFGAPTLSSTVAVPVGERWVSLADLLAGRLADAESAEAREAFLTAGVAALAQPVAERRWVQVGLSPVNGRDPALYGSLHDFATGLLAAGIATGFFFMHKPPGLRVRFQAPPDGREALRGRVLSWADGLAAGGVTTAVVPAAYEAEAGLFGGRTSMRHAHELFTADSLAWLRVHRRADAREAPAWAISLPMVRAALDGLGILGWEDRDVWDRVRCEAGRRLPEPARAQPGLDVAVRGIRDLWRDQDRLVGSLPGWARDVVAWHRERALEVGRRWRSEFFDGHGAGPGPRHAAAFHVVFHWNRAALSGERQVLVAEALGTPAADRG